MSPNLLEYRTLAPVCEAGIGLTTTKKVRRWNELFKESTASKFYNQMLERLQ